MSEMKEILEALQSIERSLGQLAQNITPAEPFRRHSIRAEPRWLKVTTAESLPQAPGVRILGENRSDGTLYFYELMKHRESLIWRPYPNAFTLFLPEDMAVEIARFTFGIPFDGPPARKRPRRG
jgi:hypothetical protein